jgi:nucleotide-binding universal stress UspA family protein
MTLRTILVPLLGADDDRAALETAVVVARRFGAHIEAVFVAADPKDSVLVLGDGMSTLMLDEIMQAAETTRQRRLEAARRSFEKAAMGLAQAEVPAATFAEATIRWRETVGRVDQVIAAEGRLADLTVVAGTEPAPGARPGVHDGGGYHEGLEAALLFTGRPVLLARTPSPSLGEVVAIAWNGTPEGSRAVAAALPWLGGAAQVHVLTVGSSESSADNGDRLAAYLAWHGVAARVSAIEPGPDAVGVAILRRTRDLGVDLLVMGAYGHSRMRELILGGVTRHILTHRGPTVLMAH